MVAFQRVVFLELLDRELDKELDRYSGFEVQELLDVALPAQIYTKFTQVILLSSAILQNLDF